MGAVIHIDDVDPEQGTIMLTARTLLQVLNRCQRTVVIADINSDALDRALTDLGGTGDLARRHVLVTAAVMLGFSIAHD